MKRTIVIIVVLILTAGAFIRLKSNHDKINKVKPNSGISGVTHVNVATVSESNTGHTLNLTGTLYPASEVVISAQAQGTITSLNVELGQYKTKGATLAVIDNQLKQLAVRDAQRTEDKLKKDLERYQNLFKGGTITEQQLDDARNNYESAKIKREQAEKQLADATVTAPISGEITQKQVEQGSFINVGNPVASMIDVSKLKIKINVSEANVYQLKVGNEAIVTTDIYANTEFKGKVTFVSNKGDDYHNYLVEVEIPNNGKNPLKAGTFANVKIDISGTAKALFVPREALIGSTEDASVYVAENGKAVLRKINIYNTSGSMLQVVSGLKSGDKVIVTGQINLEDGKEIKIVE